MAKMTVTVDNDLDNVKLESAEKLESKKSKKENVKKIKKTKDSNKEGYFKKVRNEMKLVTWPTRKNVVKYSLATIFMIVFLAAFFIGISALFDLLYRLVQGWIG